MNIINKMMNGIECEYILHSNQINIIQIYNFIVENVEYFISAKKCFPFFHEFVDENVVFPEPENRGISSHTKTYKEIELRRHLYNSIYTWTRFIA